MKKTKSRFALNDEKLRVRLRELRERCNLTQYQLAEKAGFKQCVVSQFECGNQVPSLRSLIRLCSALGCTPNDLLMPSCDPEPS